MNRFTIIVFTLFSIFLTNCTKKKTDPIVEEPTPVVDYREQYTGSYSFNHNVIYWQPFLGTHDTTINYNGQIILGDPGKIKIFWVDNTYHDFVLNESGKILMCDSIIGSFSGTHFELNYDDNTCSPGPLGESYFIHLKGDKH